MMVRKAVEQEAEAGGGGCQATNDVWESLPIRSNRTQ